MGKILTFIQHQDNHVSRASLEALQGSRELASTLDHTITAVVFGLETAPADLTKAAVDEVLLVSSAELATYSPEHYVAAMDMVLDTESPDLLVSSYTYQARDWLPRLAGRRRRPLISDCVGYHVNGDVTWVRLVFQGKLNAEVTTTPGLAIVAFQAGAFRTDDLGSGSPVVRTMEVELSSVAQHVRPGERFQEAKGSIDLSRAERIVAVGRGIGDEENMGIVQELAEILQAEMGSSRPVVDYGWLPHEHQIGSSGQTVSPKLYVAVGISGAIQHQVGMKNSGCIVAINKDTNAPIFEVADYGLVADLKEVVPRLTAALKER